VCSSSSPASYGTPFFVKAATDAGYFCIERRTDLSERARFSLIGNPSRASAAAGSTSRFHGSLPCSFHARCRPATVPGTPTAIWLLWCSSELYCPSFSHIVGEAFAGAFSRKSYVTASPDDGRYTMNPPPPMLPAVGCVTASANAVATTASIALPPSLMTSAPILDAISLCAATMPFCAGTGTVVAPVAIVNAAHDAAAINSRSFVMRADYTFVSVVSFVPFVSPSSRSIRDRVDFDEQTIAGQTCNLHG